MTGGSGNDEWRGLEVVALLFPGVGVGVVAVQLPEATLVLRYQFQRLDPLGALVGVAIPGRSGARGRRAPALTALHRGGARLAHRG